MRRRENGGRLKAIIFQRKDVAKVSVIIIGEKFGLFTRAERLR